MSELIRSTDSMFILGKLVNNVLLPEVFPDL